MRMEKRRRVRHEPLEMCITRADNCAGPLNITKKHPLDIILFCGSPGVGKSTFYWKYLKRLGYERVNQDILKTVRGIVCSLVR